MEMEEEEEEGEEWREWRGLHLHCIFKLPSAIPPVAFKPPSFEQ